MWTEILGALAIVAIVFFGQAALPAVPKLVDALCDRIRYGVQDPAETDGTDTEQAPAAAPTQQITKPTAAPAAKAPAAQSKPATPTQRAAA